MDGFYVIRTNVPEERMSAADFVLTYKIGTGREGVPGDQGVRPPDPAHPRPPRIRAHLLICMLAYYVDMHMRKALAPMLFDDERGPVLNSPVAKAELPPQAKPKATTKRTNSGQDVYDFRGLLAQLGTLTMNRIEPSGPGKPGLAVPASPTPIQEQAPRPPNAKVPCASPPKAASPVDPQPDSQNMLDIQRIVQKTSKELPVLDLKIEVSPCASCRERLATERGKIVRSKDTANVNFRKSFRIGS